MNFTNLAAEHDMYHADLNNLPYVGPPIMDPTRYALLAATICMGASTVAFQIMAREETKRFNYVAMAVTGIATLAYLTMFCGGGIYRNALGQGRDVYVMRYVDWFFTTPFFLLDLALLAGADTWDTFYVMLMNAICIAAGAAGAMTPGGQWPLFALGMVTFLMFNVKLFGAMLSKAESLGSAVGGKYKTVVYLTMGVWCIYPVMYVACECLQAVSIEYEVFIYCVIDVFAKCYCSFLLLNNHDVLLAVSQQSLLKE